MSGRVSQGWQTSLADLSLILFMITAAAVNEQQVKPPPKRAPPPKAVAAPSPQSEPLAVYEAGPGAPPLSQWLRDQAADPRQQLTVTARYGPAPGAQHAALAAAARLLDEAGALGRSARLVVEPGANADGRAPRVVLAFDASHPAGVPAP